MRQSRCVLLAFLLCAAAAGCSKSDAPPVPGTIISLSPAATDLLVAMGLGDKIVGVSPYEANAALREKLPKVGDYERIDWERVGALRPEYLVVQGKRDRLPAGVNENASALHVKPVVLQIDRLADIRATVRQLGQATANGDAAGRMEADLARRESALTAAATTGPTVPAMIALGDNGAHFAGTETFLDDALALAGGQNLLTTKGYVALDAEKIASQRPRVVFLLLPGADGNSIERATSALRRAGLSADATVVPLTDNDVLMPGTAAYTLAESMASHLRALP